MADSPTSEERISAAVNQLDEAGRELYTQAISEGYKDEICPHPDCGVVLLAHKHYLHCDPRLCPMASRLDPNSDGSSKTLLEKLGERLQYP